MRLPLILRREQKDGARDDEQGTAVLEAPARIPVDREDRRHGARLSRNVARLVKRVTRMLERLIHADADRLARLIVQLTVGRRPLQAARSGGMPAGASPPAAEPPASSSDASPVAGQTARV